MDRITNMEEACNNVPARLGIQGEYSMSHAESKGMNTLARRLTPPMRRNSFDLPSSGVTSATMTKNRADTTGDEPAMRPWREDAQTHRMSKVCQNQYTVCIHTDLSTNDKAPRNSSGFRPYLSAAQPKGRARRRLGPPSKNV